MAYRLDLQRHTAATLATPVAFLEALRKVRADGIAFDREEHVLGNHCVAAPVFDFRGRCIGAISVTAPTLRVDTRRLDSFADKVRHAARVTGQRLGGAPHGNTPHVAQEGT